MNEMTTSPQPNPQQTPVAPAPPSQPASAPQVAAPEPPRSLVPGAFLRGEIEIKSVLSRGMTNIYTAQSGDYGDMVPKLIAERETPAAIAAAPAPRMSTHAPQAPATPVAAAPVAAAPIPVPAAAPPTQQEQINTAQSSPEYPLGAQTATIAPQAADMSTHAAATSATASSETTTGATQANSNQAMSGGATVDEATGSGAFVEDVDVLPNAPVAPDESDPTGEMGDHSVPPSALAASVETVVREGATPPEPIQNLTQVQNDADVADQNVAVAAQNLATVASAASTPGAPVQSSASPTIANTPQSAAAVQSAVQAAPVVQADASGLVGVEREMVEQAAAEQAAATEHQSLQSPLFMPRESFEQDEREYLVFDFLETTAIQDYREPTNDERLLSMLATLSQGLRELETKGLRAELTTETLRVDADENLRYFGFIEPLGNSHINGSEQLRGVAAFLMKRVFAESSTMRLDDEFGSLAFGEELKDLARRLSQGEFTTVAQADDAISALRPVHAPRVESAIWSDVGRERELNEDSGMIWQLKRWSHLAPRDVELYVVADGMGGHEGGEVASDLTMSALQKHLDEYAGIDWNDNVAVRNALIAIIDAVNADVVALTETPKYRATRAKPGSTLVFALRMGSRVFVGNVGDSRAYKYSSQGLERISKDHSYVQTLLDRGEITEEEAFVHPEGSVITAHIGYAKLKTRDVFLRWFAPGDTLLLVSDGVTDMLRDRDYLPHLQHDDPALVCRALVDASNAAGGADNITAVCVKFR